MPLFEGTRRSETGSFRSVVPHSDGMAEDSWGKASLADIYIRFGVIAFKISSDEHRAVIAKIQTSSAARYNGALQDARVLNRALLARQSRDLAFAGPHRHQSFA